MQNFNAVTHAVYSDTNQEHLEAHKDEYGFESDQWAGFQQWKKAGRQVKKGAKACKILKVLEFDTDKMLDGKPVKKTAVKSLSVFNFEHTEEV